MPRKPNIAHDPARLRRRAELHLSGRRKQPARKPTLAESQRQLHELEVHQIELELQNAELQKARNELETALEKYTDLYDFAPVGYFSVDESGEILEANLTSAVLLGIERSRLIHRRLPLLVSPTSRPDFLAFLKKVFSGPTNQVCEALVPKENGGTFWAGFRATSAVSLAGTRNWCRVAVSDISVRKQAEAALGRAVAFDEAVMANMGEGLYTLDAQGLVTSMNKAAQKLFGWSFEELRGRKMHAMVHHHHPDGTPFPVEQCRGLQVLKHGEALAAQEDVFIRKDGTFFDVVYSSSPLREADKIVGLVVVFRDITQSKRVTELLRQNEALFSALIANAPLGVYVVDAQMRFQQVNPKARPVFRKVRPLIGRDLSQVVHILWPGPVADVVLEHFQHTMKTGKPFYSANFSARRLDLGVEESYEYHLRRVTLPDGTHGVVCFFNDITERKRAEAAVIRNEVLTASNRKLEQEIIRRQHVEEALKKSHQHQNRMLEQSRLMQEQLRNLSHQILSAQEEERKRISRELHDVIAQTLTGINVHLAGLRMSATRNPEELEPSIRRTQRMVEQSVQIIHQFTRELRPAVLDDLGLIPALNTFMKNFQAETGLRVSLSAESAAAEQMHGDKRTVLYRVAQEALTNIARHASARRADVKILKLDRTICMTITDDGKGFRQELLLQKKKQQRLGLLGMRERVQMVRGSFTIQSTPGKGTTVRVQIPLAGGAKGPS